MVYTSKNANKNKVKWLYKFVKSPLKVKFVKFISSYFYYHFIIFCNYQVDSKAIQYFDKYKILFLKR